MAVSAAGLLTLSACRLAFVPLWLTLSASVESFGQYHDACAYGSMALLSLSNGYLASIAVSPIWMFYSAHVLPLLHVHRRRVDVYMPN